MSWLLLSSTGVLLTSLICLDLVHEKAGAHNAFSRLSPAATATMADTLVMYVLSLFSLCCTAFFDCLFDFLL